MVCLVSGAFVELRHGGIRRVDVLLNHHGAKSGSGRVKDVRVVPHHGHATQGRLEEPNLQGQVGGLQGEGRRGIVDDEEGPAAVLGSLLAAIEHQVQLLSRISSANSGAGSGYGKILNSSAGAVRPPWLDGRSGTRSRCAGRRRRVRDSGHGNK